MELWQIMKLRTLLDMLNDLFAKFYRPSEHLIVDEDIVIFKGQWPWKLQVLFDHSILFVVRL